MKTHIKKTIALALCLVLTMLTSCSNPGKDQPSATGGANSVNDPQKNAGNETYELIFSVASKSSYVANTDMKWFCEEVERRTDGRVHISFYEDAQL